MADVTRLYHQIRAFVIRDIRQALAGQTSLGGLAASAGEGHSHDDRYYTETEAETRYVNAAGDNLTGDLTADVGVTVDGVDISAHAANVNAHHVQAHVLATETGLGSDHTISGAVAGYVLKALSATTAKFMQLTHGELGDVTANQHHNQAHALDGGDHTGTLADSQALQFLKTDATRDVAGNLKPDASVMRDMGTTARRWRSLWATELKVATLVAESVTASLGGEIIVAEGTELSRDLDAVATTFYVRNNNLALGDFVVLTKVGQVEWIYVGSGPTSTGTDYSYTIQRDLDASGANTWETGDVVLNTGTPGTGVVSVHSGDSVIKGGGPSVDVYRRDTGDYTALQEVATIGNLNGKYGYVADAFGAAFGRNATGYTFVAVDDTNGVRIIRSGVTLAQWKANGDIVVGDPAAGHVLISAGTLKMKAGTTEKVSLDSAGNANFTGIVKIAAGGQVKTGNDKVILHDTGIDIVSDSTVKPIKFTSANNAASLVDFFHLASSTTARWIMELVNSTVAAMAKIDFYANNNGWSGWSLLVGGGTSGSYQDDFLFAASPLLSSFGVGLAAKAGMGFSKNAVPWWEVIDDSGVIWKVYGRGNVSGEMAVGGNLKLDGNISKKLGASYYTGYTYVPLSTKLTSTSWDGDAFSTVSSATLINLSAVFGVPANIKAVQVAVACRDSATWGAGNYFIVLEPSSGQSHLVVSSYGGSRFTYGQGIVTCNADGNIYYRTAASGTGTLNIYLEIVGYYI